MKTGNDMQALMILSQKYKELKQKDGGIRKQGDGSSA